MYSKKLTISKGQVSIEYMLLLLAFFSALMIIIPLISYSTEKLIVANDTLLAKQITQTIKEEINLFTFLSNGSKKEFEFIPAEKIIIESKNNILYISSKQKTFNINFNSTYFKKEFSNKFKINILKNNNQIEIKFS